MGAINKNKIDKYRNELITRVNELIEIVKEHGKRVLYDKEHKFSDGIALRDFYNHLKRSYDRNKDSKNVSATEIVEVEVFKLMEIELDKIIDNNQNENDLEKEKLKKEIFLKHVEELKDTIKKIKKIPDINDNKKYYLFKDGSSKNSFYYKLKEDYYSSEKKKSLSEIEIKSFQEIEELLIEVNKRKKDNKPKYMKKDERTQEYVSNVKNKASILAEVIKKYKKIPLQEDNDIPYTFDDGVKYITFYNYLSSRSTLYLKKEDLSETALAEKNAYEMLNSIIRESQLVKTTKKINSNRIFEHSAELIQTILRIERLPKKKDKNDGISEYFFSDGIDQRKFYDMLKTHYHTVKNVKEKKKIDIVIVKCYRNIEWYIGYIHLKKYYETYHNLDIVDGYISKIADNKIDLGRWIAIQRNDYNSIDKTELQLEHEKMLDDLCSDWYKTGENNINKTLIIRY